MGQLVTISCFQLFFGIINATYDSSAVTERLFFILRYLTTIHQSTFFCWRHILEDQGWTWLVPTRSSLWSTTGTQWRTYKYVTTNPFNLSSLPSFIPIFTNFAQARLIVRLNIPLGRCPTKKTNKQTDNQNKFWFDILNLKMPQKVDDDVNIL